MPHMWVALSAVALVSCNAKEPTKAQVLVSAAASLTATFTELARDFERTHTDVAIELNFGGSSALREQIVNGAPVDVFVSANESTMRDVINALAQSSGSQPLESVAIATNRMTIAVPHNNPAHIRTLADFATSAHYLGLCAETVPCGMYAREILARAGIAPAIDTNEPDVTALTTKIALGEIDAGIVYTTDIAAQAGKIDAITIPDDANIVAKYLLVVVKPSSAASRFVQFVQSDAGRATLTRHGFGAP